MMLRNSFGLEQEAKAVGRGCKRSISRWLCVRVNIKIWVRNVLSTTEMTEMIDRENQKYNYKCVR